MVVARSARASLSGPSQLSPRLHAWNANLTAALRDQGLAAQRIADNPALRRQLRACMRGGPSTPQLKLLVLGASVAFGNMNCGGRFPCSGDRFQPSLAWPAQLESQLRAGLGCDVTVQVKADGGWTSEMAAHKLHAILHGRTGLPDVLLLDASTNDAAVAAWGKDMARRQYLLAAVESMVRRLEAQSVPVLLVDVASLWSRPTLGCPEADAAPSELPSVYAPVGQHWRLPYVSLQQASCAGGEGASRTIHHWRAGCEALDAPGGLDSPCWMHPGPTAHLALASLAAHGLASIANGSATRLLPASARAADRGTLQPAFEVASFEICTGGNERTDLHFGCDLARVACANTKQAVSSRRFAPRNNSGFEAYMDRPGKPGWIANASTLPRPRVAFAVVGSVAAGTLFLEYLRSYDARMGRADVWLDGHRAQAIVLDGRWHAHGSQVETAILPLRNLLPPTSCSNRSCSASRSEHVVHIQLRDEAAGATSAQPQQRLHGDGLGKFKITRIRTCENQTHASKVLS